MTKKGKKVWIVDDDAGIREVIQIVLNEEGYRTKGISDGTSILNALKKETPSLILLDKFLSGTNGDTIAKIIKDNKKTHTTVVIIMSADADIEQKAKSAGADDYLRKPFTIQDLIHILRRYLEK